MDVKKLAHHVGGLGARDAAFCGNSESADISAGRQHPLLGALDTVGRVHKSEIKLGTGIQFEIAERLEKSVVGAGDRHRHMHVGDRVRDGYYQCVGKVDHLFGVTRLYEMLSIEVAITKMKAELDVLGHFCT